MKKNFLHVFGISCLVFFTLPSQAATDIERVQIQLAKPAVLCGNFDQKKKLSGINTPVNSHGRFCLNTKKGILWRTQKPFSNTLRLTKNDITQFHGNNVTMKLDAKQEPMIKMINNLLFSLMSGDLAQLEKLFTVDARFQQKKWHANLTVKNTGVAKVINKIILNGDTYIRNITIQEKNGDQTFISFSRIQTGATAMRPDEAALYE